MENEPNLVTGQYDAFKHQMTVLEDFHAAQQALIADGANETLQEQANQAAKDLFIVSWFSGAGVKGMDGPAADLAKDFIPDGELDEMLADPNGLADRFAHLKAVATPKIPKQFELTDIEITEEIFDPTTRIRKIGETFLSLSGIEYPAKLEPKRYDGENISKESEENPLRIIQPNSISNDGDLQRIARGLGLYWDERTGAYKTIEQILEPIEDLPAGTRVAKFIPSSVDRELIWDSGTETWQLVEPPIANTDNRFFETESLENESPFPKENN